MSRDTTPVGGSISDVKGHHSCGGSISDVKGHHSCGGLYQMSRDTIPVGVYIRCQGTPLLWGSISDVLTVVEVLLYVHRNRRLIRDGSPGRPP